MGKSKVQEKSSKIQLDNASNGTTKREMRSTQNKNSQMPTKTKNIKKATQFMKTSSEVKIDQETRKKLQRYQAYIDLSDQEKKNLVREAKQGQEKKNPQGSSVFPERDFIEFRVKGWLGGQLKLTTYRTVPKQSPKAVVCMFHGLNSYMDHGAHIAQRLADNGYVTVGFDHRSFGRSEGSWKPTYNLKQHLGDCKLFVGMMKNLYPNLPFFSMGLSMGGMSSYYLTLDNSYNFVGSVMMAPAISLELKQLQADVIQVANKRSIVTRNPRVTADMKNDPLIKNKLMETAFMLLKVLSKTSQTYKDYNCPFMVIQGGCDKLVNPIGAFDLFRQSKVPGVDKEIQFFDKMWHDVWHEEEIFQIMDKMIPWMDSRLTKLGLNSSTKKQAAKKNVK